ncbi:MAG TPA: phosphate ABC transporter permease subunit PstC [Vicinamibacterales bacterium]|jgi:phosphate transport system permease protein|nr:phosphate ABC transporter permease subunit PstC [Vicinamibacterales bacterium]
MATSTLSIHAASDPIARPPTRAERVTNRTVRFVTRLFAWSIIALVTDIVLEIAWTARPAVSRFGLGLLVHTTWDTNRDLFGLLPAIWGTLYSSLLGLAIGTVFGLAIAIVLSQDFLPRPIETLLKSLIELLAAIPSVVYGLWGIFAVIPAIRPFAAWCTEHLGWIPIFGTPLRGPGLLPASIVLAVMVLPTVSALSRDALVAVPTKLKEAAYGLGATRWETILGVLVPTAITGIAGSVMLGFGRALGETMALAMLVGNANTLSVSLFSPATTLAAVLALDFPEAKGAEAQVLMYAALVLLAITLAVNIAGTAIVTRASRGLRGAR